MLPRNTPRVRKVHFSELLLCIRVLRVLRVKELSVPFEQPFAQWILKIPAPSYRESPKFKEDSLRFIVRSLIPAESESGSNEECARYEFSNKCKSTQIKALTDSRLHAQREGSLRLSAMDKSE